MFFLLPLRIYISRTDRFGGNSNYLRRMAPYVTVVLCILKREFECCQIKFSVHKQVEDMVWLCNGDTIAYSHMWDDLSSCRTE
jgi:hypothetical protein